MKLFAGQCKQNELNHLVNDIVYGNFKELAVVKSIQ